MPSILPIAIAHNHVPIRGDQLDTIWWRASQWAVTSFGIEALDGSYHIEKSRLLEQPDYPWPRHMAGKIWVNLPEFITAWLVALTLHGYNPKPLQILNCLRSFPLEKDR